MQLSRRKIESRHILLDAKLDRRKIGWCKIHKAGNTEPDRQIRRWNSAFLLLLIVLKKQKTKMVWSYISQLSNNKTGHFFHLTSLKFSDMKKADTFGLRNSLFMAFFSLQYSITRKVGCCFSVKKSWDFNFLLSFFLFFFKTCDHF